jgi:hypothetical protein
MSEHQGGTKVGSLEEMQALLWKAAERVGRYVEKDQLSDAEQAAAKVHMSALHALSQASNAFANLSQPTDLEARIAALERRAHAGNGNLGAPGRGPGARVGRR